MNYTSFDMFAGAGGFTLGLEAAGFKSLGAIEFDLSAKQTIEANFGIRPMDFVGPKEGDIRTINEDQVIERLENTGLEELDLLVASPPCQGFSKVGRGKLDCLAQKRGSFVNDERNSLYLHAIRLLQVLRPKVFLFENVMGILHLRGRNVAEEICEVVSQAGYISNCTILNSAWYGVPQTRERVIIMGVREDLGVAPMFPLKSHTLALEPATVSDNRPANGVWRNPDFFVNPVTIGKKKKIYKAVSVREAFDDLPPFIDHLEALASGKKYRAMRNVFPGVAYASEPRNWFCQKNAKLAWTICCR